MNIGIKEIVALAEKLMLIPGISGYEGDVAQFVEQELRHCTDSVEKDRLGNVTGFIRGTDPSAPKVMVVAHMDQIGMVVTKACDNGLLRVTKNGSVPDKILPGCELLVRTVGGEYLHAAAAVKPHHAMSEADRNRVEPLTEAFVDIGATSRDEVFAAGVQVGCPVQYKPNFVHLMGNRVAGTAIDNRMSLAVMLCCAAYLYENKSACDVYLCATVQEEHNLRGGMVVAHRITPDILFCLDVTLDSTQPGLTDLLDNPMGSGPTMCMYSFHGRGTLNGTIAHEGLSKLAQDCADELGLHLNRFAMRGLLCDSTYIQTEGIGGVACLDMGFPARYTHSPMELCDMKDVYGLYMLICRMTGKLSSSFNFCRF